MSMHPEETRNRLIKQAHHAVQKAVIPWLSTLLLQIYVDSFLYLTHFFFIEELTEVCTLVHFHRNLTVVLKIKSVYVAV